MENADGFCLAESKREFVLEIDSKLRGDDFITAICHEMVHVKQYARNQLPLDGKLNRCSGKQDRCLLTCEDRSTENPPPPA